MKYRQLDTSSEHGGAVVLDGIENTVFGPHCEIELSGINSIAASSPNNSSDNLLYDQECVLLHDGGRNGIYKRNDDEDIEVINSSEFVHHPSNHPFLSYPYIIDYLYPPDQ